MTAHWFLWTQPKGDGRRYCRPTDAAIKR